MADIKSDPPQSSATIGAKTTPEARHGSDISLTTAQNTGNKEELLEELARKIVGDRSRSRGTDRGSLIETIEQAIKNPAQGLPVSQDEGLKRLIELLQKQGGGIELPPNREQIVELLQSLQNDPAKAGEVLTALLSQRSLVEASDTLLALRSRIGAAQFDALSQSLSPELRLMLRQLAEGNVTDPAVQIMHELSLYRGSLASSATHLLDGSSPEIRNEIAQRLEARATGTGTESESLLRLVRVTPELKSAQSIEAHMKLIEKLITEPRPEIKEIASILRSFEPADLERVQAKFILDRNVPLYEVLTTDLEGRKKLEVGLALHGKQTSRDAVIDNEAFIQFERFRLGVVHSRLMEALSAELREAREKTTKALEMIEKKEQELKSDLLHHESEYLARLQASSAAAIDKYEEKRKSYLQLLDIWLCIAVGVVIYFLCRMAGVLEDESVLAGIAGAGCGKYLLSRLYTEDIDPKPIIEDAHEKKRGASPIRRPVSRAAQIRAKRRKAA